MLTGKTKSFKQEKSVLIFELGGGTLDVSLLKFKESVEYIEFVLD